MKYRRIFALAMTLFLAAGLAFFAISPASAATHKTTSPVSNASVSQSTVSVPLTGYKMTQRGIHPNGTGPPYYFNCGSAQLTVNASTHRYRIYLHSIQGIITYGYYNVTTDGIGDVPVYGGLNTGSTSSNNLGSIPIPGIFISEAYAGGTVFTSDGYVCFFVINAPWN